MKYLKILIIFIITLLPQVALALPEIKIESDKNQIKKGESVTTTIIIDNVAAWNLSI